MPFGGEDHVEPLADQLGIAVAEQLGRVGVGEGHHAVAADLDHDGAHQVDQRFVAGGELANHVFENAGQAAQFVAPALTSARLPT